MGRLGPLRGRRDRRAPVRDQWPRLSPEPERKAAQVGGLVGGTLGLVAGVPRGVHRLLIDRNRYDIKKRQAAEHKDPNIVTELYQDIADGYDTEAWHAIGLLADYQNGPITKQMLETMEFRLNNKEVYTTDPGALARHAVKSLLRTKHLESMEALKPYARDFESRLGIEVRRLNRDLKEINKVTSKSGSG